MKKLNRKGFTLIELLAVIVILAIILVIAVPSVLNIQRTAKQNTTKDEALMLIKSIETCMAAEQNTENCDPGDLDGYYERADKSVSTASGVSNSSNTYFYTIGDSADSYEISNFKYSSNGYGIYIDGPSTTSELKAEIGSDSFSISG